MLENTQYISLDRQTGEDGKKQRRKEKRERERAERKKGRECKF